MGLIQIKNSINSILDPLITKKKGISYLILFVTSKCNCRCPFCFNWKKIDSNKSRMELNLDEIGLIAKSMPNLSYLTLSGGEPSMRDDLPEICKIFYDHSHVKHITIPTNGFFTEKIIKDVVSILENCPKLYLKLCLSLDDLNEEHDKIRGVSGLYHNLINTIKKLKEVQLNYPRLSFLTNTVFTAMNQNRILEILDFINLEVEVDYSTVVLVRGDIRNPEYNKFDIQNYIEFRKEYMKKRLERIKISNFNALIQYVLSLTVQNIVLKNYLTGKRKAKCYALRNLVVIDDIGNIYSCEPLYDKGFVGNLRENDFNIQGIFASEKSQFLIDSIKRKDCNCTWENTFQQSLALTPKYYPKLIFIFIKILIRKILTKRK